MTVENIDFRGPGRLPAGMQHRLSVWLDRALKLVPDRFASQMPFRTEIELRQLETRNPVAVLQALTAEILAYRVAIGPEQDASLFMLPLPLALVMATGLVGDAGAALPEVREPTIIEESLIEYLLRDLFFKCLKEGWPEEEPIKIELGIRDPKPKFTRVLPADASVVVMNFTLRGPFGEQTASWVLQQKTLAALFSVANDELGETAQQAAGRRQMEAVVQGISVDLTVTLGTAELPLSLVSNLSAGDLVILEQRIHEPLVASVAGNRKFTVWPGRVGTKQAIKLEATVEG